MRRLAYKARALASKPHIKFIKLRMKCLVVLGLILFASQLSYAVDNGDDTPASIEPGVTQTVASYEKFMGATYNASCSSCSCRGCCPVIVRNCAPKYVGSVINAFSGWRGNAAIIVDWGCTEYNPCGCCPKGRLCTLNDKGFTWYVDWGDGSHDTGRRDVIGPLQVTHQYSKSCRTRTYGVTVYYCHDPGCPSERCCDSIYRRIDVSEDPMKPHPDVPFGKPLKVL